MRIETPAGPTWTNSKGYAVLPSLQGYQTQQVQIDTKSLPKNVDVANGLQETNGARGSVSYVNFDAAKTRRVLVALRDSQNKPLPAGAGVFDANGQMITMTGSDGSAFVPSAEPGMKLTVESPSALSCSFTLDLPSEATTNELHETGNAVCA